MAQCWSCQIQADLLADPHMLLPHQLMSLKNMLIENKTGVLDLLQKWQIRCIWHVFQSQAFDEQSIPNRVGISNCNATTSVDLIHQAICFSTSYGNLSRKNWGWPLHRGSCISGSSVPAHADQLFQHHRKGVLFPTDGSIS